MFLLRGLLSASQPFWRRGWTEVRRSIAAATRTTRARAAESASAAKPAASRTRATETSAGARTAEAAATATGARTAEPSAARTRTAKTAAWWTRPGRTILAGARFAHGQVAAHERLRVELVDDLLGDGALGKFDERKPTRAARFAIDGHDDVRGLGDRREVSSEIRFGSAVGKVPYEETDSHCTFGKPERFYLRLAANAEYEVSIRC